LDAKEYLVFVQWYMDTTRDMRTMALFGNYFSAYHEAAHLMFVGKQLLCMRCQALA
jgi:hypothetical protein